MGDRRQRKLKNYLLDRRFQLKYTGMVLCVTVAVACVLGYLAYDFSKGQTEAFTAQLAAQRAPGAQAPVSAAPPPGSASTGAGSAG